MAGRPVTALLLAALAATIAVGTYVIVKADQ